MLDVGAGDYPLGPPWVTVDAYNPAAQVKADMWNLPYPDHSVAAIHSSHSLEHVSKFEVPVTLAEWRRVLAHGGELHLEVPDLDYVCRHWLEVGGGEGFELDMIFGLETDPGQFHQTGWNAKTLAATLHRAGFVNVRIDPTWSHDQSCLQATAVNP